MNLRRTQEAMPLKLKIAQFRRRTFWEFIKHFSERYGKEISLFYCGLTLWYLFHWSNALDIQCFCVLCANAVPFGYNFDRPLAFVNVYTLPRIACEGLPRSGDWTRIAFRSKVVLIWIKFSTLNVCYCLLWILSFKNVVIEAICCLAS